MWNPYLEDVAALEKSGNQDGLPRHDNHIKQSNCQVNLDS